MLMMNMELLLLILLLLALILMNTAVTAVQPRNDEDYTNGTSKESKE